MNNDLNRVARSAAPPALALALALALAKRGERPDYHFLITTIKI
jgi:hypothetical protein